MKVVCDNCRAVYKVPDAKLVKAVNKATCRNCGHRMLIPRPKPGADPDQRTLVTAVPPTPVGAPARSAGGRDLDAQALPGRRPPHRSTAKSLPPSALAWENAPETALQANPNPGASSTRNAVPSMNRVPRGGGPRSMPGPISRTPPPGPISSPRLTPPPSPHRSSTRSVPAIPIQQHDPAGDLNWAILGTFTALVGSFCLALLSVFTDPLTESVLMWLGLALSFGGGVITILVLMTGNRGRRPARSGVSLVLGTMVAVLVASVMVGTKWGAEQVDLGSFAFVQQGGDTDVIQPSPAPTDGGIDPTEGGEEGNGEEGGEEGGGEEGGGLEPDPDILDPVERSVPRPAPPVKRGNPVASVASAPRPTPRPATPPPPAPVKPPPAPPTQQPEPAASGVPVEAVRVMLGNNMSVKRCFVPLHRAGALPPRVDVKFNILPEGTANGIKILTPQEHADGSELENCLKVAIAQIKFPPTNGNGTSITYPFILQ